MGQALKLDTKKMQAEVKNGIGWLTFNNPARRNAISLEMWEAMGSILEHFQFNEAVRVVVMKGAGDKAFVSGADISEFEEKRGNLEQSKAYAAIQARANSWLKKLDKPLIAMIQGACIGGGLGTALNADIRFATPDSRFGVPAAKLGLGYEYEGSATLARLVGPSNARDILFSARFLDAEEAFRIGLINYLVPADELEDRVRDYAAQITTRAPLTVKMFKESINQFECNPQDRDSAHLRGMVDACFDSEDYKEGRRAFMDKRAPEFLGR